VNAEEVIAKPSGFARNAGVLPAFETQSIASLQYMQAGRLLSHVTGFAITAEF